MKKPTAMLFIDLSSWDEGSWEALAEGLTAKDLGFPGYWILTPAQWGKALKEPAPGLAAWKDALKNGRQFLIPTNFSGMNQQDFLPTEASQDCGWSYHHPQAGLQELLGTPEQGVMLLKTPSDGLAFRGDDRQTLWIPSPARDSLEIRRGSQACQVPLVALEEISKFKGPWLGFWWAPDPRNDLQKTQAEAQTAAQILKDICRGPDLNSLPRTPLGPLKAPLVSPREKATVAQLARRRSTGELPPALKNFFFKPQGFPGTGEEELAENAENLHGVRRRTLVASMQGDSVLSEGPLQMVFQSGHPAFIRERSSQRILAQGEIPWIATTSGTYLWRTISAFSLEGDYSWGLRQTLALEGKAFAVPGRMVIDHFFVEESQSIHQSVSVRFPRWHKEETVLNWSFLPWSFPVLSPVKQLKTLRVYPDGQRIEGILEPSDQWTYLEAADFFIGIPGSPLGISFPGNQAPRPHHLELRLRKSWGGSLVEINPEAAHLPRPKGDFEAWDEHFNLILNLQETLFPLVLTRKQANEMMPPFVQPSP